MTVSVAKDDIISELLIIMKEATAMAVALTGSEVNLEDLEAAHNKMDIALKTIKCDLC